MRGCVHHQVLLEERRGEVSTWHDIAPGMLVQSNSAPVPKADDARCRPGPWVPHHMWRARAEKWLARNLRPLASKEPAGASMTRRHAFVDVAFADGSTRTVATPDLARDDGDADWVVARPFVLWESGTAAWVVREAVGASAMHPLSSVVATRIDAKSKCPAAGCTASLCTRACAEPVKAPAYVQVMNVTDDDRLNLRVEPSASSAVVAALPASARCLRYEGERVRNGDTVWLRITYGAETGWVSAGFVEAHPVGTCRGSEVGSTR